MKIFRTIILLSLMSIPVACVNPGPGAYEPAQMRIDSKNEQIKKNVENKLKQRTAAKFPKLSDIPQKSTPKYDQASLQKFQQDLSALGQEVRLSLATDLEKVTTDRALSVQIMERYRRDNFSLEDAGSRLQKRIIDNRVRLKEQMARPVPQLGGLPPKNMREPK